MLIVSPDNASQKVREIVRGAKSSLYIFAPSIEDEELLQIITSKSLAGIDISICTPYKEKDQTLRMFQKMTTGGIQFFYSKAPFTHAKTILVDDTSLLI